MYLIAWLLDNAWIFIAAAAGMFVISKMWGDRD